MNPIFNKYILILILQSVLFILPQFLYGVEINSPVVVDFISLLSSYDYVIRILVGILTAILVYLDATKIAIQMQSTILAVVASLVFPLLGVVALYIFSSETREEIK